MNHDDKGRLQSLTNNPGETSGYLTGLSYNIAGQVTGLTLGNGVAESFGYDANRLQLTTQAATKSGGPTGGLMNLAYGYQAAGGQMGTGSTAGNAGQLMSISGTINGTTESAAYTYDDLGRLITSNQTSNSASAQRRFAYDRWGNRTGVWDAVSGGNQIQTIALQQSGGAPTNRITSVTGGSTVNYIYDAVGNVTNDGVHSYTYDAENRVVSVDGGATAQYKYDHQNRRVSKIIGSSWTHYIWQGSQVIGEHDATTGYTTNPTYQMSSARIDYIYSGSQMISSRERASSGATWTTKYYLRDRLSTRLMMDASGNVIGRQAHLPFGEDFGESGSQQKHHFTTYERDSESGLDYATNRTSSPVVARFLSADPYRASEGASSPQSWNRYAYVENDPINYLDVGGLMRSTFQFGNTFQGPPPPSGSIGLFPGGNSSGGDGFAIVGQPGSEGGSEGGDPTPPPPANPCASSVVSGSNLASLLSKAVADAMALFGKSSCSALFQGRDAGKFLSDLVSGGFITFQNKFAKWDGKKWVCSRFNGDRNGAVTSPSLAQVPGSSGSPISAGFLRSYRRPGAHGNARKY